VVDVGEYFGKNTDGGVITSILATELTGSGTEPPYVNIPGKKTLTGNSAPIEYFGASRIISLYNPFSPLSDYHY
jgi:hypothetical protein